MDTVTAVDDNINLLNTTTAVTPTVPPMPDDLFKFLHNYSSSPDAAVCFKMWVSKYIASRSRSLWPRLDLGSFIMCETLLVKCENLSGVDHHYIMVYGEKRNVKKVMLPVMSVHHFLHREWGSYETMTHYVIDLTVQGHQTWDLPQYQLCLSASSQHVSLVTWLGVCLLRGICLGEGESVLLRRPAFSGRSAFWRSDFWG